MSVRVKICGVRTVGDARDVIEAGADAMGLNFFPASARYIGSLPVARQVATLAMARGVLTVGVFVNPTLDALVETAKALSLDAVQLHGEEPPEMGMYIREKLGVKIWKAYRVFKKEDLLALNAEDWPCDALLLDTKTKGEARGGTGRTFDWSILDGYARAKPLILAGGLTAANVADAVRRVRPEWVDVAGGVESAPGCKDAQVVRRFIAEVKKAEGTS